jgi:hypothetical protein
MPINVEVATDCLDSTLRSAIGVDRAMVTTCGGAGKSVYLRLVGRRRMFRFFAFFGWRRS